MLHKRVIAVPETRQLDVLTGLLERRGASVRRCPLVSIKDTPDRDAVIRWLDRFVARPPKLLILYTGEGLTRLLAIADEAALKPAFVTTLQKTPILARGPKPAKVLRQLSVAPTFRAKPATTEGIIECLDGIDTGGRRVAVQVYGSEPNEKLIGYLASRSIPADCVAPYIYADESDDDDVRDLILELHEGRIDMLVFTSKTQVERLFKVARKFDLCTELAAGLERTAVGAVGPVVANCLDDHGVAVAVSPGERFFLKPLVQTIVDQIGEWSSDIATPDDGSAAA